MNYFGKELRRQRRAADLTQENLAEAAKLGQRYIGELENGKKQPSLTTVMKLSKGLGITPDELIMPVWQKMKRRL